MNAIAEQRFKMFNDAKSVLWKREELKALAEKIGAGNPGKRRLMVMGTPETTTLECVEMPRQKTT